MLTTAIFTPLYVARSLLHKAWEPLCTYFFKGLDYLVPGISKLLVKICTLRELLSGVVVAGACSYLFFSLKKRLSRRQVTSFNARMIGTLKDQVIITEENSVQSKNMH